MKLELLANRILTQNPKCAPSGSLALRFHGIKLRNEPTDIDIYCPYSTTFIALDEMDFQDGGDEYPGKHGVDYKIEQYLVGKIKVDVFKPHFKSIKLESIKWDGIRFLNKEEILKFKVLFALGNLIPSQQKHKEDMLHILNSCL